MIKTLSLWQRSVAALLLTILLNDTGVFAADFVPARRLGLSLTSLQQLLEKVSHPVVFALRPGSSQGTQETRLPNKAGAVQASSDPDNLAVIVLWMPVDTQQKRIALASRPYLEALVKNFLPDPTAVSLWLEQVLQRALEDDASSSHLESQLLDTYQFKASYVPALSPPMLSVTITKSDEP